MFLTYPCTLFPKFASQTIAIAPSQFLCSLLHAGPLREAVAASLAVRFLYAPVSVDGVEFRAVRSNDWMGLLHESRWRPGQRVLVHLANQGHGSVDAGSNLRNWIQVSRLSD